MFLEKPTQALRYPLPTTSDDRAQHPPKLTQIMATDFAMPVQQFTSSPTHYALYNSQQSQQISPTNSANATPYETSPTSPRTVAPVHLPAQTRQLRPPKSPMYMPAVLRPTDPPKRVMRNSPLTPPTSTHSSFDDTENARSLRRQSTGDSGKFVLGAIDEAEVSEGLGKVTALPTRDHWKVCQNLNQTSFKSCTTLSTNLGIASLYMRKSAYVAIPGWLLRAERKAANTSPCTKSLQASSSPNKTFFRIIVLLACQQNFSLPLHMLIAAFSQLLLRITSTHANISFCRQITNLHFAMPQPAPNTLLISPAAITVAAAATSSVTSTPLTLSLWIKTPTTTRKATSSAPVNTVMGILDAGMRRGVAELIARIPTNLVRRL